MNRLPADRYLALIRDETRGLVPALGRGGLCLASLPYGWAVGLRNLAFDRGWRRCRRAAVPVVSVGNLTAGGTGKTPCVEYVVRHYRQHGLRVAVLSRGYGGAGGRNDEALVLEEELPDVPHLQGADRGELAAVAVEELDSEILVLDDGFQHRQLARDLDVVLVDATNPWGHGHLLPRGLLRESRCGLRRAGVVVLTRCDQASAEERGRLREQVARLAPGVPVAETMHRPVELVNGAETAALGLLRERPVAAFCGIGNPEAFRRTLRGLGADVRDFRTYPDHHPYSREDVGELTAWARRQPAGCLFVTTQKDLVKLRVARLGPCALWAVRVRLHFETGREALDGKLQEVIQTRRPAFI
ncbi:MAG TPA: tetraacyldisaccharide 4'-kinase [Gemmataceae bacterium]|nr:tetraacyldisaccharide 4'-kinase [Gemmataceae bacterium]